MKKDFHVSLIIPFYNSEKDITSCIDTIKNQDINDKIEIIFVDDCSKDSTAEIIKNSKLSNYKLLSLNENKGPSAARNEGIVNASGDYVFFLDVDDTIESKTLSILYETAKKGEYDMVFCDKKRIYDNKNFRDKIFAFNDDKEFNYEDITSEIKKRVTDPDYTVGVAGCHGKLIKRSILTDNNISFENKLRFLEDEIFIIDVLSYSKKIKYIKKQLYIYNINPDLPSGRSNAFNFDFPAQNFKIMRNHIKKSLENRNCNLGEVFNFSNQALIYYLIYTLISYSLCIFRGKVNFKKGLKIRKKIIKEILNDYEIIEASKYYKKSKNESYWIPKAIQFQSTKFLEIACNLRTKSLLNKAKNQKNK